MYEQDIPNYKHDFLGDKRWVSFEGSHHKFYFFKDSVAGKDIGEINEKQELAYKKILDFLKVPEPDKKIEFYLYPSEQIKKELMGDDGYAVSIYNEFKIHALYTEKIKPVGEHEETHLLSLPWGLSISFFQEGLAEYFVGRAWDRKDFVRHVKDGYGKKMYPELKNFMSQQAWMDTDDSMAIYFYSLAGAFVSFLIKSFGKDRFETFYGESNRKFSISQNSALFDSSFGTSIEEAEQKFKSSIAQSDSLLHFPIFLWHN